MYLEDAMMQPRVAIDKPVKWLTSDYNALKFLHDNVVDLNDTLVKKLFIDAKLLEIYDLADDVK
jgi:hypothetical protein